MLESTLKKPIAGLLLIAGAAGGPYLLFETDVGKRGMQAFQSESRTVSQSPADVQEPWSTYFQTSTGYDARPSSGDPAINAMAASPGRGGADPFSPPNPSVEQTPIVSLAEILRFDITPEWVMSRFPRVTTQLSELNLDGLRVPLITGSTPSDLAGTLTYYFDRYKRLQRVSIHATVGDPSRYSYELRQAYRMSPEASLGGDLYVIRWNSKPVSLLYVSPASVVYADSLYGRYQLFLELNQAGMNYGLSPEATQLIQAGQQTNRW
jgi:hypothetical protein